jgi:ABC-type antimicrobial peptide transport system permease subunit
MKNFLLIFRKLKKNKTATSLGIAGLVIGMMCVVYIFLLVTQEISFDRFHEKTDRIFVVHAYLEGGTEKVDFPGCPPAVSTALKAEYPEVETTCRYIPPYFQYLVTGNISNTLNFITKTCQTIEPAYPVDYAFFNEKYKLLLASEINLRKLVGIFSIFAIVVLCLGMLGMVMFLIEQKTKEIGVRKCLGENVMSIILQLIRPFLVSGIIAGPIAIPVTWYTMSHWLQNYSYRIHLNIWIFIFAGLITVGIAMVTVFWESLMAAMRNPVEALRYE